MALSVSSLIKRAARGNEGMYVIAGLGNPGRSYEKTRHNMGFQVIDRIAEKHGGMITLRTEDGVFKLTVVMQPGRA